MGARLFAVLGGAVALRQRPSVRWMAVLVLLAVAALSILDRDWWSLLGEVAVIALAGLLLRWEYRPKRS